MKRVFSGIQPTNTLHLGNYMTLKNFEKLQYDQDSLFCIVNMHAITVNHDPNFLREYSYKLAAIYMASGLDPDKATLFIQSDNPHHAELAWILSCYTYFGELSRMTQFKDKSQKQKSVTTGLFFYPVLMAADILLYHTDLVPTGDDQKQHVELTRDIAERFNKKFGETFVIPKPLISTKEKGSRIMSLQDVDQKMSKSDPNEMNKISLFDSEKDIKKKIMRATTDSETIIQYDIVNKPGVSNLLIIHSSLSGESIESIVQRLEGKGYGDLKKELVQVVTPIILNLQQKTKNLLDTGAVHDALTIGAKKSIEKSTPIIETVKSKIGFLK